MKKTISILGSTGSIGLNTLKIVKKKKNIFSVNILVANKNFNLISKQIRQFQPKIFVINDVQVFHRIKKKFNKKKIKIVNDIDIKKSFFKKTDITIAAIPGIAGLKPTLDLIKKSKKMLIANKESIICGWNLIKKISIKHNTKIIPIDSEHYSIMKLLEKQNPQEIKKIYITASGGPFLRLKYSQLKKAKSHQALKHPKWKMGKKISIDSATLMNKMLELIEAQKLFSIESKKIDILIHPESLVHAVIELKNGLFKFICHETSMLVPLANAMLGENVNIYDFIKTKKNFKNSFSFNSLNFSNVDKKRFPVFKLKSRINEYVSSPIIINASNEILVDQYLKKKIGFTSFFRYLSMVVNDRNYKKNAIKEAKNIVQVLKIDEWSRATTLAKIKLKKDV